MTFQTEIMLRHDERVFTETIDHPTDASSWTEHDVEVVLTKILRAINRRITPDDSETRAVALRGITWIVHPTAAGNVLALEIHSASAAAGPFDLPVETLDGLIGRVLRAAAPTPVVH